MVPFPLEELRQAIRTSCVSDGVFQAVSGGCGCQQPWRTTPFKIRKPSILSCLLEETKKMNIFFFYRNSAWIENSINFRNPRVFFLNVFLQTEFTRNKWALRCGFSIWKTLTWLMEQQADPSICCGWSEECVLYMSLIWRWGSVILAPVQWQQGGVGFIRCSLSKMWFYFLFFFRAEIFADYDTGDFRIYKENMVYIRFSHKMFNGSHIYVNIVIANICYYLFM